MALLISALGTLLFGGLLVLSFASPLALERAAREVVRMEVQRRVGERIDVLSQSRLTQLAGRALRQTEAQMAQMQEALRRDVPARVADVVAQMMNPDCECRRRMAERTRAQQQERLDSLGRVRERLGQLIESAYGTVRDELLRELRIVSGSNAVAFALLGVVTLLRRRATWHLLLPVLVLTGAVLISTGLYLFNQDWLHTLLFGQYVGWAYSAYLAVVAGFLADLAFNRGRVSTEIVNGVLQAVGEAGSSISPC
ncbi:MAG: hypothetical protein Q4F13_06410 [Pseudomonadota bacterium]|nr:hypothetical protein [Pseudomonadota bacterium]